jgi:hypothetical protein
MGRTPILRRAIVPTLLMPSFINRSAQIERFANTVQQLVIAREALIP